MLEMIVGAAILLVGILFGAALTTMSNKGETAKTPPSRGASGGGNGSL